MIEIRRQESLDKMWDLNTQSFAWMDKRGRRELFQRAKSIGDVGTHKKTAFEMVDGNDRVMMIGASIATHGAKWKRSNPHLLAWLRSQNVSETEAIRRHQEWTAAKSSLADQLRSG